MARSDVITPTCKEAMESTRPPITLGLTISAFVSATSRNARAPRAQMLLCTRWLPDGIVCTALLSMMSPEQHPSALWLE